MSTPSNNLKSQVCSRCGAKRSDAGIRECWSDKGHFVSHDWQASNNLKAKTEQLLIQHYNELREELSSSTHFVPSVVTPKYASQTLNLILDTILASEEMQDEPETDYNAEAGEGDYDTEAQIRNALRADLRAMLEGMR